MVLRLGIDTGGTFTDAVLIDDKEQVIAAAKAETTHADLVVGIGHAVRRVLAAADQPIGLVGLSTTLATNAIVEGRGGRAALVLIGLEPSLLERAQLRAAVADAPVVTLAGGHDAFGRELAPLELGALERAFSELVGQVEAAAVVSQFAVREPTHELAAAAFLRERFALPVTCSHELTSRIDAARRALTTFLNARLLPEIDRLLRAVGQLMGELAIAAPLMVVRGDGSLIPAEAARKKPVETILSGPAASVVGAIHLARLADAVVVDVGGTTTDIAAVENGRPRLARRGARIAGYETMVEAVELETTGLGGDSEVRRQTEGRLSVGPTRVVPIAALAMRHPPVLAILEQQIARPSREHDARFAVVAGELTSALLDRRERRLAELLAQGPVPLETIVDREVLGSALRRLEGRGLVRRAGFTPTDAAHVLGRQTTGSVEAARLAAALEARKPVAGRYPETGPVELFARQVLEAAERAMTAALVRAALARQGEAGDWLEGGQLSATVERALSPSAPRCGRPLVEMRLRYMRPLVGVGAPAALLLPRPAVHLDTALVVPPHYAVCNAVGAVVGEVIERVEVLIGRDEEERFLVHLPDGTRVVDDLATARALAGAEAAKRALARAREAGAVEAAVAIQEEVRSVETADGGSLVLDVRVVATAHGRPPVTRE
ncbi:Acetophenone carboxylase alpha subunit [bacterium HR40]|nr:Acetophenone carboxylase alpha subunit [bacterium HR40]